MNIPNRFFPGGHESFGALFNLFVHVIMYTYYFLAALGPHMQKYLWWKRHLTKLQMVQFATVLGHSCILVFKNDCGYPIIQSAISSIGSSEEISLPQIANLVAKHFRIRMGDIRSSSRKQNLVRARSLAMFLSRRMTSKSMHQIGDYYGGRDHTTVLHAVRKTESLLQQDDQLRHAAEDLSEKLSAI